MWGMGVWEHRLDTVGPTHSTSLKHLAVLSATQGEDTAADETADARNAYAAAVARLTALLQERQALYGTADITVSLEGSGPDADIGVPAMEVCYRVLAAINQRIKDDTGALGVLIVNRTAGAVWLGEEGPQLPGGSRGCLCTVQAWRILLHPMHGSCILCVMPPHSVRSALLHSQLSNPAIPPAPCRGAQAAHGL